MSELSKKLASTCGILLKVRDLLPTNTLISVYNPLFMSFLQYGIIVWVQTSASYIESILQTAKNFSSLLMLSMVLTSML